MSPFFLNAPDTTARQSASAFRQSLLLLLRTYRNGAPTASPTNDEQIPDPEPQPQPPTAAALQSKTTPSHLGIMIEVSAPAPESPLTAGELMAIPRKHSGGGLKAASATLRTEGVEDG